jgi:starch-binding outer membrane protein, SusD/RagB family
MPLMQLVRRASVATSLVALTACNFFDVSNPGPIADEDLNTVSAMPGLVTGMSFDLSQAIDATAQNLAIMADELYHGGSYAEQGLFNRGIVRDEDVNGMWGSMQQARWVAESGIERMKTTLGTSFDTSPLAARANIYAGLANRLLGENVCQAVFDGSAAEDFKVHFSRAEAQFTEALRIAAAVTPATLRDSLNRVAYGGRASVRAWQGKWTEAATDAALVPTSYVFVAPFSTNTTAENNDLVFETNNRLEYTVYNTQWAQNPRTDPRVPWDTVRTTGGAIQVGQDGRTPFFRQRKLNGLGADIPLVKGTEMLMLRAEAALRNNDVPGAMALINQQRAFYGATALPPLTATTAAQAWPILQKERGAVVWLESRRLWDLRRWNAEPAPIKNTFLDNRDKCIPVSEEEQQSNPNVP